MSRPGKIMHAGRYFLQAAIAIVAGFCLPLQIVVPTAFAQQILTAIVLFNGQNSTGYNPSQANPGEFQRFAERYLEHLQVPYELVDVASQPPPDLSARQLIISGHRGLNLSATWQTAISTAVTGGVGFVNLDSDTNVGQQTHIQSIFSATGSTVGTQGSAIAIPQAVMQNGSAPHYIAGMQRRFRNDPAGDLVYSFHPDAGGVLRTVTSTLLQGASGTVIARLGTNPLILATSFGSGRAVHFGTLEYLRADRFGFLMGVDDLFWRSLVWSARKPFVVRGFPKLWTVQMDDTLEGWGFRVRDMYDTALTGEVRPNGTGGPWRITGYSFTRNLPPGSAERASVVSDINAGYLQISPHADAGGYGDTYWVDQTGNPLNAATWAINVNAVQDWITGNGGADRIPFISRSMVPHFWNLSDITGSDLWNTLGFRYITEIQRPGIAFYSKTNADRLRLRPFRSHELPPFDNPDENYPIYIADDYTVNNGSGPQTFFNFTTQIIDLTRYDRQDLAWPNDIVPRPVEETIDQFQNYTWRLWSSLAPVQIYTHDGSQNYILSTVSQRQQVVQEVSTWLNDRGVRHVFMDQLGDYMYARTRSTLAGARIVSGNLVLNYSGNAATADGQLINTEILFFDGDNEGLPVSVLGFTGGATITLPPPTPNPRISLSRNSLGFTHVRGDPPPPSQAVDISNGGTGTLNWAASTPASWLVVSPSSGTAPSVLTVSANVAALTAGTYTSNITVTASGASNSPQTVGVTLEVLDSARPVPTTTGLAPSSGTAGGAAFTLSVNGTGFISGSVVRWNGADRTTTFVSATQLQAAIPASDIATAGTATVTVFTASPGGGTSNPQSFSIQAAASAFFDDFNRADGATLANGWIEKTPAAFSLVGNAVNKAATGTGYADNLVYRPASEAILDGEASVEVRFTSLPLNYAQLFVRGQTATISNAGAYSGYLLFIDNDPGRALLDRVENGAFVQLAQIALNPQLNTTDTYRLRLRATGTNPVALNAFVERLTGTGWQMIGQATVNDAAATRFTTAGTVGFSGHVEGGSYRYDNFTRTSFDGSAGNPVPATTSITPSSATAGGAGFTLIVNGTGFVSGSVVRWNGADRATTFVSATQLQAAIPASDIATAGTRGVTVFTPAPGGGVSQPQSLFVLEAGRAFFIDTFNRPDNASIGNGWTEKFPTAFSIQNNEVVNINTDPIDYHDAIVYRPLSEDRRDVEVGIQFRVLSSTLTFPQVHARVQRNTITLSDTLQSYIFFVDGFEPAPGRAIIAVQPPLTDQFECYIVAIPFPAALQASERYRLRFRVTGVNPVVLTGIVERFAGSAWQVFASGTVNHDASTQRDPNLFCAQGSMPSPITSAGAVAFAKWTTNNEVVDDFFWMDP